MGKRSKAAMKVAGKKVKITGKQRKARKVNIEVARRAKKKSSGGKKAKPTAMDATKRKFIKSQSQKTLNQWITNAKARGDTASVKELTPFLKKKKSDAAFKRRGNFLAGVLKKQGKL